MDYRGLAVLGACLAAGLVPLLPACKGPDPGAISFEERPSSSGGDIQGGSSGATSSGAASSTSGATDGGGTGAITDVFKDPKTGTVEAFKYEAPLPTTINAIDPPPAGHQNNDAPPMQGKTCVRTGCHADAPKWGAGGTVYGDLAGAPFPAELKQKVQIRIVKPDGTEYGTFYPDDDGNFYLSAPGDAFPPAGSRVGIRTDTGATKMMAAPIEGVAGANCNSAGCHETMKIVAK